MAALPYMPLFVADYLADTAHLSTTQHGAYLLLIMNYWQRGGPLPDDDARLAKIARVGPREWARMRDTLSEFFAVGDGAWSHSRLTRELARVEAKSLKSKAAAQASVQRRFGERSTSVEPTDTHTDKEKKVMPDKSGAYAFFGKVVKLTDRHLTEWRRLFHSIPDIVAELSTIDEWWQLPANEAKRSNWFLATKGMLNKKHQANLADVKEREDDPLAKWMP